MPATLPQASTSRTLNVRLPLDLYQQLEARLVLHKHFVAVYWVQGEEVHILTLFHTSQQR